MADSVDLACRAASWSGWDLTEGQQNALGRYAAWLVAEAIPAGGLGPAEGDRVWSRHVADSLTFAVGWSVGAPQRLLDVGSGVGLPGIPLAILWPGTEVALLDRGGRRVRLLQRAIELLDLPNAIVRQADVLSLKEEWPAVVMRGALKVGEAVHLAGALLDADGVMVMGLSRRREGPTIATGLGTRLHLATEVAAVPDEILDGPAWLLIMRRDG
jgi:16S rRNA (guanine527-N7)-methyltransferase